MLFDSEWASKYPALSNRNSGVTDTLPTTHGPAQLDCRPFPLTPLQNLRPSARPRQARRWAFGELRQSSQRGPAKAATCWAEAWEEAEGGPQPVLLRRLPGGPCSQSGDQAWGTRLPGNDLAHPEASFSLRSTYPVRCHRRQGRRNVAKRTQLRSSTGHGAPSHCQKQTTQPHPISGGGSQSMGSSESQWRRLTQPPGHTGASHGLRP